MKTKPFSPLFVILLVLATINTSIKVKAEFLDVNNRSTYYDAITYVEDEGIVNGYSDHTFRASMYVTRGEFTKIIINSIFNEIDISNCVQNYFPDVDKQNKFINYICVAKENDIIKGYSDNTYQPEKYITVGEGIKIISNSYGYTDENSLVLPEFENVFMPYIKSLETLNVLPEELNRIGDFITRGEMVEIIYRLKNSIGNKTHTDYLYLNKKTVDVNLLTTPVAMQPIDIVAELSWVEDNIDYADDTHFFKLGVINDFSVSVNGNIMDLNGFDFCVAIYTTRISVGDSLYPSFVYFAFDQSSNTTVTFDSKYYEFNDNILEVDNEIYTPDYEYFYSHSVSKNTYASYSIENLKIKSDKNNFYNISGNTGTFFKKTAELIEVDSLGGNPIYIKTNDAGGHSYIKNSYGFLVQLAYVPTIVLRSVIYTNLQDYPDVMWDDGTFPSQFYDYISIGNCFENVLETEQINNTELTATGTSADGSLIYEKLNKNDDYLLKIYDEYKSEEYAVYKYNSIKEDDVVPYSYNQFLENHPIFYYKDPFGRYIKFASRDFIMTGGCAKPAIYLYPESETSLSVSVKPNGVLTFTLPDYSDRWDVVAKPNGSITNLNDGKEYDYLWWESRSNGFITPDAGFVVKKDNVEEFLDDKLALFGLNDVEIADFKDYWLKIINKEESENLFVTFLFNEQVNRIAQIEYSTPVDSELRIFMLYKPVSNNYTAEQLEIPRQEREGFVSVEWGGAKI